MEALQTYFSRDYNDPFSEPPPEIMAEIKEGLDAIYPNEDTELGAEVKLTREQTTVAILYHLSVRIAEGDSYRGANTPVGEKQGVVNPVSLEVGVHPRIMREALYSLSEDGAIIIETQPEKRSDAVVITDIWLTPATTATIEALRAANPEDVDMAESYLMRQKRETIIMVRQEISNEERLLGIEPSLFEDLSSLQSLRALQDYLMVLHNMQRERLEMLGTTFD